MLRKKEIRDLPVGFTPVLSTGKGRASSYNSSTQPKNKDKFKQVVPANPEKGKNERRILHEKDSVIKRRLAGIRKAEQKELEAIDEEKELKKEEDGKDNKQS